jgi:transcriptional antiterminator RfaH
MSDPLPSSQTRPKESGDMGGQSPAPHLAAPQVWYLVHCKPNGEQMALRNLENQDFSAFLPLQKLTRRKGTAFQTELRPLFPGYMFVAQDPTAGQWRKINNTRGVARLVRLAAEPTPVPPTIMDQLFARCDATGVFQQSATLVAGDGVKITQGPFAGAITKIIEIDPNQRVHLLLDFMGQTSTLTIDAAGVAPTS